MPQHTRRSVKNLLRGALDGKSEGFEPTGGIAHVVFATVIDSKRQDLSRKWSAADGPKSDIALRGFQMLGTAIAPERGSSQQHGYAESSVPEMVGSD